MTFKARVSVFGGRDIDKQTYVDSVEIGERIATENYLVYCGGGEGVMEAIAKGVKSLGGTCWEFLRARKRNRPVVGYKTLDLKGIHKVNMPTDVINKVIDLLNGQ